VAKALRPLRRAHDWVTVRVDQRSEYVQDYTRPLRHIEEELDEVCAASHEATRRVLAALPERRLVAEQAEWHVRGLAYHLRAIARLHREVIEGVASRALAGEPSVVVMHAPEMQDMLFEFYAFVVLARISLDQLGRYLTPLFTNRELPNSLTEILKGSTDCPLYREQLPAQLPLLRYLIDIRDCLVHHRSFATSDNTVAAQEGEDISDFEETAPWQHALARVSFRRLGGERVVVNVLLPDEIWHYNDAGTRSGMARSFSYDKGTNLMRQCIEFMKLCASSVFVTLDLLRSEDDAVYTWQKR
jgi:hypothetical protein